MTIAAVSYSLRGSFGIKRAGGGSKWGEGMAQTHTALPLFHPKEPPSPVDTWPATPQPPQSLPVAPHHAPFSSPRLIPPSSLLPYLFQTPHISPYLSRRHCLRGTAQLKGESRQRAPRKIFQYIPVPAACKGYIRIVATRHLVFHHYTTANLLLTLGARPSTTPFSRV